MLVKRFALAVAMVFALNGVSSAADVSYGWEDGVGTILGSFGNLTGDANISSAGLITPNSGSQMLTVSESPIGGTPQAYLAYIEGLEEGDSVTASFYTYDDTPSASPSARIWGHYALNGDVTSYAGSASGNSTYPVGTGWEQLSYTWVIPAGQEALVVEGRLYSSSSATAPEPFYFDDLEVTVTSGDGTYAITTPGGTTSFVGVPEPTTCMLALFGLAGLATTRRR